MARPKQIPCESLVHQNRLLQQLLPVHLQLLIVVEPREVGERGASASPRHSKGR